VIIHYNIKVTAKGVIITLYLKVYVLVIIKIVQYDKASHISSDRYNVWKCFEPRINYR